MKETYYNVRTDQYVGEFGLLCQTHLAYISDTRELERVNKSLDEITGRWEVLKVEITSAQTSMEETVAYWKRYSACVDLFQVFLADAEKLLDQPAHQRGVSRRRGG